MYLIWLLISIFFGLLIKKVAYGLIMEQSMLRRSFWMTVDEVYERESQLEYIVIQSSLTLLFLLLFYQKGMSLELFKLTFFTIMMVLIGYVDFKTTFVYRLTSSLTLLFLLLFYQKGMSLELFKLTFFTIMMVLIGYVDFKTTFVYRLTTFITFVGGLFFILLESIQLKAWPIDSIMGCLIGFIVIGLIVLLTRGMGEGDIEIASLCGLFLGTVGSILTLFFGIILGGIAGTILLTRQKKGLKDEIAFGPYLVAGAFIAMLWGNELFQWYLSLF